MADEIFVDLMAKASGIGYLEASQSLVIHEIDGVPIPFASPELLWRMKCRAGREKDHVNCLTHRRDACAPLLPRVARPRSASHRGSGCSDSKELQNRRV